VGRIVEGNSGAIAVPVSVGGGGSATQSSGGSSATSSLTGAVFPRTAGHVSKVLVVPGQQVVTGQPLALLDDGGAGTNAVELARIDLASAELELKQKQVNDPLRGFPPTAAELAAAQSAVTTAQQKLARLLGPARPADVSAAHLDVKRAQADLETLLGGTPKARADALQVARQTLVAAQKRLAKLLAPADPADVAAAKADVARAQSDLATLLRPNSTASPEALASAQQVVSAARHALAVAQTSGDNQAIKDAQVALDEALADLASLLKPGPGALPVQIQAAQDAVDAANAKLARLLSPANAADVAAAQLDVDRAQADLQAREAGPGPAALAAARQAVDAARAKLRQLVGRPLSSDVAAARLDVSKAKADLAVLRTRGNPASSNDIALARLKVDSARDRLASAQAASKLLTVRAPADGTVTAVNTSRGAPVDLSTAIVTVDNLKSLAVSVDLSEFDAAHVKVGLRTVVKVDALGGKAYAGRVAFAALTGTDNGGVVTFPVRVSLTHVRGLKPGMNVSVRIIIASRHDVVRVPLEALSRDDEDRPIVTILDPTGEEAPRRVALGLANNKSVEIVTGLHAGDRVVLPEQDAGGGGGEEG
jgi:RND family efflux transporter MFP subunit